MRRQQRGKRQPGPHLKQACNQADIYIPCTAQHVQITVHYRGNNIGKPHYTEKIRPLCNAGSIGGWVKENRQQQPARCKHRDGQHQADHAKRFQRITQALAHAVYIVFSHILPRVNGQCIAYRYHNLNRQRIDPLHSGVSRHLEKEALRFGDHVLQHTVSVNNDFPEQAWADTLFMAGFFLLRMGVLLKDEQLIDDALNQYYWHIKYLQDPESGLYYHGYNNITGDHMSGIKWGRANAWAAYTMSQVGIRLPQCYLYPKFLDVVGSLNDQLAALKLYQTENGLWRTIVDDETSYEEVSASAGIAAAMIAKGNPLHIKYINKSIPGMLANVSPDGRVLNVSGGTAVMKDADGYRSISRDWIQGWGQGLALAFFAGVLNYDNVRSDGAL